MTMKSHIRDGTDWAQLTYHLVPTAQPPGPHGATCPLGPQTVGWPGTGLGELFWKLWAPLGCFPRWGQKWGSPRPGLATCSPSRSTGGAGAGCREGSPPEPKY